MSATVEVSRTTLEAMAEILRHILAGLPKSAEDWREKREWWLGLGLKMIGDDYVDHGSIRSGFAYSAETLREIDALKARLTVLCANGRIEFDPVARDRSIEAATPLQAADEPPALRAPLRLVRVETGRAA